MDVPTFILYEHATGYSLFRVKEFEDIGNIIPQVKFNFFSFKTKSVGFLN